MGLSAAQGSYYLDHVIVDRVVRKEKADSSEHEEHEAGISLYEAEEIIMCDFILLCLRCIGLGLLEEVQYDQCDCEEDDVQDHEDVHAELADGSPCKERSNCKANRTKTSCQTVVDVASCSLILEIHCRYDRLVHHLYHIYQREDNEYHDYPVLYEEQENRAYEQERRRCHRDIAVRELALLIDKTCDKRLEYD